MRKDIVMPRLSDTMEEGEIRRWLKHIGDSVTVGEPLVEVDTDKATVTYDSDVRGTLVEIVTGEGERARAGERIAWLETDDSS